jgi:hypothetical protein
MMKNIFILLISILLFTLLACKKDCKNCHSVTTDNNTGKVIQEGEVKEYCGDELDKKENEPPSTVGDQTTKWVCE